MMEKKPQGAILCIGGGEANGNKVTNNWDLVKWENSRTYSGYQW